MGQLRETKIACSGCERKMTGGIFRFGGGAIPPPRSVHLRPVGTGDRSGRGWRYINETAPGGGDLRVWSGSRNRSGRELRIFKAGKKPWARGGGVVWLEREMVGGAFPRFPLVGRICAAPVLSQSPCFHEAKTIKYNIPNSPKEQLATAKMAWDGNGPTTGGGGQRRSFESWKTVAPVHFVKLEGVDWGVLCRTKTGTLVHLFIHTVTFAFTKSKILKIVLPSPHIRILGAQLFNFSISIFWRVWISTNDYFTWNFIVKKIW